MVGGLEDFGWILGIQRILTIYDHIKLVGGLEDFYTFFMFSYLRNNHPNWRTHIFFSGVETTNQHESERIWHSDKWSLMIILQGDLVLGVSLCLYIYIYICLLFIHIHIHMQRYQHMSCGMCPSKRCQGPAPCIHRLNHCVCLARVR